MIAMRLSGSGGGPFPAAVMNVTLKDSCFVGEGSLVPKSSPDFNVIWNSINVVHNKAQAWWSVSGWTLIPTNCQYSWSPVPDLPAYDDLVQEDWSASVLGAGIGSQTPNGAPDKPNPGNGAPAYTGYDKGFWESSRTGIGAFDFTAVTPPEPNNTNNTEVGMAGISQTTAGFGAGTRPNMGNASGDRVDNSAGVNPIDESIGTTLISSNGGGHSAQFVPPGRSSRQRL